MKAGITQEDQNMNDIETKTYKLTHPLMFAIVMRDESLCKDFRPA